jgi:hypothetical protein
VSQPGLPCGQRPEEVLITARRAAVRHGDEACAANSMSCIERPDLCGEEPDGWQRGAYGRDRSR